MSYTQPPLFDVPLALKSPKCHVKGCAESVVGSSLAKPNAHVCKGHNEREWAAALARGKDGYWKQFGQQWLEEMNGKPGQHVADPTQTIEALRALVKDYQQYVNHHEYLHGNWKTRQPNLSARADALLAEMVMRLEGEQVWPSNKS